MAKTAKVRENDSTRRIPLHEQKKNLLTVPQKPGFKRRFVNDTEQGQRINRFLKAGWRIVEDETQVGDAGGAINQNQSIGSGVRKHVGDNVFAVLMEIEQDLYDADQAAKAENLDRIENSIYKDHRVKDSYGEIGHDVELADDASLPRKGRR